MQHQLQRVWWPNHASFTATDAVEAFQDGSSMHGSQVSVQLLRQIARIATCHYRFKDSLLEADWKN